MSKIPTSMALAFLDATVKNKQDLVKVDNNRWIPRAVAACAERNVGMVSLFKPSAQGVGKGKHHAG